MRKKLSRYGNSLALIIDKPILDLLHITEKTMLKISTDGTNITITPEAQASDPQYRISDNPKVQKAFEETLEEYTPALKKLAKN